MVTSLYAGVLAVLYAKISLHVIKIRKTQKISLGSGEDKALLALTSAHSNFSNYAVFLIVLSFLAESANSFPTPVFHILGVIFTLGRLLHYSAFIGKMDFKKRVLGMKMTLFPLIVLGILNIVVFMQSHF